MGEGSEGLALFQLKAQTVACKFSISPSLLTGLSSSHSPQFLVGLDQSFLYVGQIFKTQIYNEIHFKLNLISKYTAHTHSFCLPVCVCEER